MYIRLKYIVYNRKIAEPGIHPNLLIFTNVGVRLYAAPDELTMKLKQNITQYQGSCRSEQLHLIFQFVCASILHSWW